MRRFILFFSLAILALAVSCASAEVNYTYLSITGTDVNVRAEAKLGSKVLTQVGPGYMFIAEAQTVTAADGSKWYKIVMSVGNGYTPLNEDERFGVAQAYISASFAHAMQVADNEGKTIAEILARTAAKNIAQDVQEPQKIGNPGAAVAINTIKVSNAYDFLEALGSNRVIEMESGEYNLSEWDPYLVGGSTVILAEGVSWSEKYDGGELTLKGIKNLTIRGSGEGRGSEIVVEPRYSFVMKFIECSDIVMEAFEAGHSKGGYCDGGVFGFENSSRITISYLGMYGCGTVGLELSNVSDMNVVNSRIFECTYHIMTVNGGKNITFRNCSFYDNQEFTLISVNGTGNMSFTNCKFNNNRGEMFAVRKTTVTVSNSTFSGNSDPNIRHSNNVTFTDCAFNEANVSRSESESYTYGEYGEITLKDNTTDMTVNLYPIPDREDLRFYGNQRFGYGVRVAYKFFTKIVLIPDNGDGMILESNDGKARFRVTGGFLADKGETSESFDRALKAIGGEGKASYYEIRSNYWELYWRVGDTLHMRKFTISPEGDAWGECEIYSERPEYEVNPLDKLLDESFESFEFAVG